MTLAPPAPQLSEHEHEHVAREELPFLTVRLLVIAGLIGLVLAIYAAQLYKLSVLRGPEFQRFSENNFLLSSPVVPPRGKLVNHNGRPLAINQLSYEVRMSPYRQEPRVIKATVARLAAMLGQPKITNKADAVVHLRPRWKSETLATGLTLEQVLPILEQSFILPGVEVAPHYRRYYPEGAVTSAITGYVGSIDESEAAKFAEAGYLPDEKVGKSGPARLRRFTARRSWRRDRGTRCTRPAAQP